MGALIPKGCTKCLCSKCLYIMGKEKDLYPCKGRHEMFCKNCNGKHPKLICLDKKRDT